MKTFFRHFRFSMFLIALLCVGLGVVMLLWPDDSMQILCYGFGGVLVLSGILQVAAYLAGSRDGFLPKLQLVSGIIVTVVGVWVLLSPRKVLTLTVIVLGILLLYHGIMDVKYGFDIQRCGGKNWALALVFGLATCGVGVLVLVDPFESGEFLLFIVGLGFVFDGVTDLFTVVTVAHAERKYELASRTPAVELAGESAAALEGETPAKPAEGEETPAESAQSEEVQE